MSEQRRKQVLDAIVHEYVKTGEPVGSRTVVETHQLGVSPATVRNDMAALEEAGLIAQPHASAGRIPTDAGYRTFVNSISRIKPLSRPERAAIEEFLSHAVDVDDVLLRTVHLLAELTHHVAVVQYPSVRRTAIRHVEVVELTPQRLMVVIITDSGQVEQSFVALDEPLADLHAGDMLRTVVAEEFDDTPVSDVAQVRDQVLARLPHALQAAAENVLTAIEKALGAVRQDRVVVAGAANLARYRIDFDSIFPLLDAIEQQVVLLRLLADSHEALHVGIGHENDAEAFSHASVVSASYGDAADGDSRVGIIGPTRMDYPGHMASVYAVATYLSNILAHN